MKVAEHNIPLSGSFRTAQLILCISLFFLIILGAAVRLSNAGLACPDWPLCFGEAIPTFNFQIFMEWIHRVIAAGVGLVALIEAVFLLSHRDLRREFRYSVFLSLFLFGIQAFLGRQTVLELLRPEIVNAHLMGGYALFLVNIHIYRKMLGYSGMLGSSFPPSVKFLTVFFVVFAFFQATVGGTVSANYAGLVCPDFPTCQGKWWPGLSGLVGIKFLHRLGAFVFLLLAVVSTLYISIRSRNLGSQNQSLNRVLAGGVFLIVLQIVWGVGMIYSQLHPALSLAHSATAIAIFTVFTIGAYKAYGR